MLKMHYTQIKPPVVIIPPPPLIGFNLALSSVRVSPIFHKRLVGDLLAVTLPIKLSPKDFFWKQIYKLRKQGKYYLCMLSV